jgi:hypothetical protein
LLNGHVAEGILHVAGEPEVQPFERLGSTEQDTGPRFHTGPVQSSGERVIVHGLFAVDVEDDGGAGPQPDDAAGVIGDPAQGHERAHLAGSAQPASVLMSEGDGARHPAPQPERSDDQAVCGELVQPCRREVTGTDGGDDPVVGSAFRMAESTVAEEDIDVPHAGGGQPGTGSLHQVVVDVDRGDVPVVADQVPEQCGVVSHARSDLEDPMVALHLQLLQHHRDHSRLGCRADRDAAVVLLGVDRLVRVGLFER